MIDILKGGNLSEILKTINKHKSILIIGPGEKNYQVNKIVYLDSPEVVNSLYGESELSEAFSVAKKAGAPYVFIMNVKRKEDYIEIADILKHYDFSYIVPVGTYLSDSFNDGANGGRKTSYVQYLLNRLSGHNFSTILATDNHASLYEDLDSFIEDMKDKLTDFKNSLPASTDKRNISFIANNLKKTKYANALLAGLLCHVGIGKYPSHNYGEAIFDIDSFDIGEHEIGFFKNRTYGITTVENLLNLIDVVSPEKILTIDTIVKYIKRELDLSGFSGQPLNAYQQLRVERALEHFFESLKGDIIHSYEILFVRIVREGPGFGSIEAEIAILPANSLERFSVRLEG